MGLIIISVNIVCEAICWLLASKKNRNSVLWGLAGLLTGPIATLVLLSLSTKDKK